LGEAKHFCVRSPGGGKEKRGSRAIRGACRKKMSAHLRDTQRSEPSGAQLWHEFCSDIAQSYGDIMSRPLIVTLLLISAAPVYAQDQQPDSAKLKTDAQKVVSIISRDRLKTQTYCQILELSDQIDQDENPANTDELAQKIDSLEVKLGPEFMTLVHSLSNMDPGSPDAQDIRTMIESLDSLCGD
jgi:hypothetical protein